MQVSVPLLHEQNWHDELLVTLHLLPSHTVVLCILATARRTGGLLLPCSGGRYVLS